MTWQAQLLSDLAAIGFAPPDNIRIHLAMMVEPFMGRVERGEKTIESRWYLTKQAPYLEASEGDIIVFKLSGGAIRGWCKVVTTMFFHCHDRSEQKPATIVAKLRDGLGVDDGFEASVADKRYVSLLFLGTFHPLEASAIRIGKTDRRGWVIVRDNARRIFT